MINVQSITQKRTGNINLKIEDLCCFPTMQVFEIWMKGFVTILPYKDSFLYLFFSKHCGEVQKALLMSVLERSEIKYRSQMPPPVRFMEACDFSSSNVVFTQVFLSSPLRLPHYVKIPYYVGWEYIQFPTTRVIQTLCKCEKKRKITINFQNIFLSSDKKFNASSVFRKSFLFLENQIHTQLCPE